MKADGHEREEGRRSVEDSRPGGPLTHLTVNKLCTVQREVVKLRRDRSVEAVIPLHEDLRGS